jgi:hypothetical protein
MKTVQRKQTKSTQRTPAAPPESEPQRVAEIHDGELPTCAYRALGSFGRSSDDNAVESMLSALAADLDTLSFAVGSERYQEDGFVGLVSALDRFAWRARAIRETVVHQRNRERATGEVPS